MAAKGDEGVVVELRPGVLQERKPFCAHRRTELDEQSRRVKCLECEDEFDAFGVLLALAQDRERYTNGRDHAERQAKAARERLAVLEKQEKNAKARKRSRVKLELQSLPEAALALRELVGVLAGMRRTEVSEELRVAAWRGERALQAMDHEIDKTA